MWHKLLERNDFISNLYHEIPKLINVRIIAIKITDEGRRVTIDINMPKFADNPPAKWRNSGYNTVFVELDFFDVQEFNLSYNKGDLRGNIIIEKIEQDKLKVHVSGIVNLEFLADVGMIQSVSGYIDSLE